MNTQRASTRLFPTVLGPLLAALTPLAAFAQAGPQAPTVPRFTLPPVVVTAQKQPVDAQRLPVSVTAVSGAFIQSAGITTVSEAALFSPNTHFAELSARKISNASFRGIGSSPANPGVTTYIDGVPQLNANSSNIELLDVDQIEFVRGPQSALFGRNTLGGIVNITSGRPSLTNWTGSAAAPFGNAEAREVRGSVSGPLARRVAVGLSVGWSDRSGFATNDLTGHRLDSRSATFGKAQVLWTPTALWEARAIVSGERARDGDYALGDLGALRGSPLRVARDFEGRTSRDILSTTVIVRREGRQFSFSSTTGLVRWETRDLTDLDYTALPLVRRDNAEEGRQLTQEVRLASASGAPARLSGRAALTWQSGLFLFTQNYRQDAINTFAPFVLSPLVAVSASHHSPQSALDDVGLGVYGQGTIAFDETLEVTLGARVDHERKDAALGTFYSPPIAPPVLVTLEKTFSTVSPQLAVAYRLDPGRMVYLSAGRGFKAGGFNPASPPGSETYGEEHTSTIEGGLKASWASGRALASAAVFYIDWEDMQLNMPSQLVPGQFYISNVAGARSAGLEFQFNARPLASVDLFGAFGLVDAHFTAGSVSGGTDVSGNDLPNTPRYTASAGVQYSRALGGAVSAYGRGDVAFYGAYRYDDANREGQDAYWLANVRAGVRGRHLYAEAWVKNAFDTRYIPVAFAYGSLAPSGFIGESGRPRTFGIHTGVTF